jgi:carbonic anhydrase
MKISNENDIPEQWQKTPIGDLLRFQNLDHDLAPYNAAQLLIGMCMDHRKQLRIPENFAYIIRTGGANLRYSEFKVSYAIALGGIRYIALLGHDNCGMVNLMSQRERFIQGLCQNAGWSRSRAEDHFMNFAPMFEIDNAADFVAKEAKRLMEKYGGVQVAPLFYTVEDGMLSMILED